MRPRFLKIFLGGGLIVLVGVGLWWRGRGVTGPAPGPAEEGLRPELTLSVNGARLATITPGTPLVFELALRNDRAAEAAGAAEVRERMKRDLEERVQARELTRQQADEMLKRRPVPASVPSMAITLEAGRFSFSGEGPQGATPLPWWPKKMVDPVAPTPVTLDENEIASATFVVAPEETASTAKGTYRVRASFENRTPGQWQGNIASNPVEVTVREEPRVPTGDDLEEKHLVTAEYFLALRDYDRAIAAVQQVFAIAPQSIDGLVLLGQAYEGKGDFRAALDAYEKGYREFRRRYPGAHPHPPRALTWDIQRMRKKLGIKLPGVEEPVPPARR